MTATADTASTRTMPLEAGTTVELLVGSANVRVHGTDAGPLVIRTRDGEPLDEQVVIETAPGRVRIRDVEGGLRIGPLRFHARRIADLDLEVPRGAPLEFRTLSGDLDATGIRGSSRWTTASGDVRLAIESGSVAIESMSGDILVAASEPLAVTARAVSGDIRVSAPLLEALDVAATSGDIRVEGELRSGGTHVIASVSGDVDLATSSPVRVDTRTIAGDVRVSGPHRTDGGRGRRTVIVGAGSIPVEIRTTSGDIGLRALQATPATPDPGAFVAPVVPVPRVPYVPVPPVPDVPPSPAYDGASPASPAWAGAGSGAEFGVERREATRLEILRALERGDLDVEAATHRLQVLEDAGPRPFRGLM